MPRLLLFGLAVFLAAATSWAQSLGEAAAREREKRQRRPPGEAKVYTDEDLKKSGGGTEKGKEGGVAPQSSGDASGEGSGEVSGEDASRGTEAEWRERARGLREAIHTLEVSAQDIQSRLNALLSDRQPYGLTEPNRLQTLEAEKVQLREALEKTNQDLAATRQALDDLHDEARRRRVPPGWLRES